MRKVLLIVALALSVSAQEAPKNVQVLVDRSPLQLQRDMNLIRASLGVTCEYCHVQTAEKGWDFASDEKGDKQRAREMMKMTMDINAKHFGGNPVVSCMTCHGGKARPVSIVQLPVSMPEPPKPGPDRSKFPQAKELIARYASSVGDIPSGAWTIRGSRVGADGKAVPFELVKSGNDVQIISTAPDGSPLTQTLTGDGGWVRTKEGVRPMRASMVENLREITRLLEPVAPAALKAEARVIGREMVDGRDVFVVADGQTRLQFDAATGFLVRKIVREDTPIGRRPKQTDYSDYRDVGKAKVPFTVRVLLVDPWVSGTWKADEVKVGAVDSKRFEMPK